jgi:predicted NUDIX family NTP pyrophosphohydrolase
MYMTNIKSHSFGILLHRVDPSTGKTMVFLGHADGPRYWNPKYRPSAKEWGIPKGRKNPGEKALQAAKREFQEEVGIPAPDLPYKRFMDYNSPQKRTITVFSADAQDVDVFYGNPEIVSKEYPPNSGTFVSYSEFSEARWFPLDEALNIIMWGQKGILDKLEKKINTSAKL